MIEFLNPLRDMNLLSVTVRVLLAVICGGLVGLEREYKRRPAGFRTHILICLGAAMTTLTGQYLVLVMNYNTDMGRLGAQVVAGIGFIGAGCIIVTRRRRVKGLTTAAGMWTTRTTSHIPISEVSSALSVEKIFRAITLCHKTLKMAGFENPRIGVAALNPHAGEGGKCGREEIDIIAPAIEKAKEAGMNAMGPDSSDILFHNAFNKKMYDGVVTMFHDQGQIALKLIGFSGGITIAGGQPYPVVTCGHGTAYDIAGKNIVTTDSFANAVKMASQMAANNKKG